MAQTPEQRRKYRLKYPEKVKEHRIKYLDKKIRADPKGIEKTGEKLRLHFNKLTRLMFSDELKKECQICGTKEDLQIHHIRYVYPINKNDLMVLCRRHHIEEHQKVSKC
jgi:5-methylcytosine-specific restriction endonuclease McrA